MRTFSVSQGKNFTLAAFPLKREAASQERLRESQGRTIILRVLRCVNHFSWESAFTVAWRRRRIDSTTATADSLAGKLAGKVSGERHEKNYDALTIGMDRLTRRFARRCWRTLAFRDEIDSLGRFCSALKIHCRYWQNFSSASKPTQGLRASSAGGISKASRNQKGRQ